MEVFRVIMEGALTIFKFEFSVFGFNLSLWEVFLFDGFMGVVAWFLGRVFGGD